MGIQKTGMEEASENSKEPSQSAHANEWIWRSVARF